MWLFFYGLFAKNILYLFIQDQQQKAAYTSGNLQQQSRGFFKEKSGEAFTQRVTWELQLRLFYLSLLFLLPFYTSFSPPPLYLFFLHLILSFICHPLSTDHWNWYKLDWTISQCFSYSMCWALGTTLYHKCQCFSAIVGHSHKPIKCQPHSSIATSVNCSHLEMSMSKLQYDRAVSWKSESTSQSSNSVKIWR